MSQTRHKVTKLMLDEVSVVDHPGDAQARMAIVKSRSGRPTPAKHEPEAVAKAADDLQGLIDHGLLDEAPGQLAISILKGTTMDDEAIQKSIEDAEARMAELGEALESVTKRADEAEAEAEELRGQIAKMKAKGAKMDDEDDEDDEEEVMKSLPESVRKRLEEAADLRKRLDAMDFEKAVAERTAVLKSAGVTNAVEAAPILERIAKGNAAPEDAEKMQGVLTAMAAASGDSPLFKSLGRTVTGPVGDPKAAVTAAVADIRKAQPGLTEAQAMDRAMQLNPHLYDAMRAA